MNLNGPSISQIRENRFYFTEDIKEQHQIILLNFWKPNKIIFLNLKFLKNLWKNKLVKRFYYGSLIKETTCETPSSKIRANTSKETSSELVDLPAYIKKGILELKTPITTNNSILIWVVLTPIATSMII